MDPKTAVTLLTLHLLTIGGLVLLVARHNEDHRGLRAYGVGSLVFGAAYITRLALGLQSDSLWALGPDAAMVTAATLFVLGQRHFMQHTTGPVRRWLLAVLAYSGLHLALTLAAGQQARHVSLNGVLAAAYLTLAWASWRGLGTASRLERPAMRFVMVITGGLGVATALRALDAAWRGVPTLFAGPTAQAYYALSSVFALLLGPAVLWWMFVRLNDQLAQLATHDPLTGALNRNGLVQAVRRHFAARTPVPLVWLMADIDHFKRVNDSHGHAVGDQLLQAVARTLLAHVRGGDFVARLGGEEFLVAAAGLNTTQALELAERLRTAVAAQQLTLPDGRALGATISLGVSQPFLQAADWEAALQGADRALYRAKDAGRNQAAVA